MGTNRPLMLPRVRRVVRRGGNPAKDLMMSRRVGTTEAVMPTLKRTGPGMDARPLRIRHRSDIVG